MSHDHSQIIYQNIVRKSKSVEEEVSETNKKETPSKCENHLGKEKYKKESKRESYDKRKGQKGIEP